MKPTSKMAYRLTKSAYLQYLKCPQEFWLEVHEPLMSVQPMTLEHEHLRQQGYAVESYVKQLQRFQTNDDYFVDFQRTFQTSDLWARSDVVVADRTTGEIEIYEIKSSSSVKEEHYDDMAFQLVVAERSGVKVKATYVVTMNSEYVRDGDIDPEQLFTITDVTSAVEQKRFDTEDQIRLAFEYLKSFPAASLAEYCVDKKLDCRFLRLHFEDLPNSTVFDLVFLKHEKRRELLRDGIIDIVDIPDHFPLSDKQRTQVEIARSGAARIDGEKIASILSTFQYPIHFLDYETFAYAIPQFNGLRPFQQMVFQYSLHTIDAPGAAPRHSEFLSRGEAEPAHSVAAHLRNAMADGIGTVLVWYEAFEKGRNEEMGMMYPEFKAFFEEVNAKTFDLMKIFSEGHFIHPDFRGRTSIKKVLPVLAPDLDYNALGIAEGLSATIKWYRAATWPSLSADERETIFNDLLEYCTLDTWAMVRIYRELQKVAGISG